MSILIKGMEMPENCWDCPLQYDYICCSVMDDIELTDENEKKRDSNCPLEEVPETHDKRTETHACDCISRQAAIEVIDAVFPVDPMKSEYTQGIACGAALAKTYVEQLPSAQLEKVDTPTVDTPTCKDAVSRQAVYNVLDKMPIRGFKKDGETIHGLISLSQVNSAIINLPSAQPEINLDEWCTDCKEYDKNKHCCPRWNRVIRQTLKDMKEEQPEIIRCKDCKYSDTDNTLGVMFCWRVSYHEASEDGFCSWAERRTDVDVES